MKRFLGICLLLPSLCLAAPNLTSPEGMTATCAALPVQPNALKTNAERQAFVVCHDLALLKQMVTWFMEGIKTYGGKGNNPEKLNSELHQEFGYVRDQLRISRDVLLRLKLKSGEGLLLTPAAWQMDWDGNGKLDAWERYLFAIPKRNNQAFEVNLPRNQETYYQQHFDLQANFRVDHSDVLWVLAYHQFAEGLMEILLAHRLNLGDPKTGWLELVDSAAMRRAHQRIGEGFASSAAMRRALLAETDDTLEWIPNPRQQHSVFPLALDAQAFEIWGQVMAELQPLWAGKTLLAVDARAGGLVGQAAKLCPAGQGLNLATFFQHPNRYPSRPEGWQAACQNVDAQHPVSGLAALINQATERGRANPNSPAWQFVRYLYWVN